MERPAAYSYLARLLDQCGSAPTRRNRTDDRDAATTNLNRLRGASSSMPRRLWRGRPPTATSTPIRPLLAVA